MQMPPHRISSGLGPPQSLRRPEYLRTLRRPAADDWAGRLAVAENEINHLWIAGDRKAEAIEVLQEIIREHGEHIERQRRLRRFLVRHWLAILKVIAASLMFALTMLNLMDVNSAAHLYKKAVQFREAMHLGEASE
jgi:hypothetical protein